ncbi:olfactory receptor 52E4-like [Latimeria chalumnae]|uniref:olfactory receptor 52E4-like n=1 Tax=Latimeria chalumnae TaxID=7897 RepID=UPI0006D8E52E|nr:PREDICTED: olfactory receptor 52E4-like [Latimeria chalumnae]|eukprot:XP_006009815.2 PREDICTED: olfactory receptor 52E4-like [Latimeria chalumnae]
MDNERYFYFVSTFLGYLMILISNVLLISVIVKERSLHEPMYIFICNLACNGLYGATAFFPKVMTDLLYKVQTISRVGCLLQIYCLHTYGTCELGIIAVMAYDRYVSICKPLRYSSIMTQANICRLLVLAWGYPIVIFTVHFSLTVRLPMCESIIEKVYCDNWSVVKLSCVDITVNSIFGLFVTTALVIVPIFPIVFSYFKIWKVCIRASKEAKGKAMQTLIPHMVTLANYVITVLFELLQHRFDMSKLPHIVHVLISVQFVIIPPLLNPVVYGLRIKEIKKKIANVFQISRIMPMLLHKTDPPSLPVSAAA